MTEYIVFGANFDKEGWEELGRTSARSARAAINDVLSPLDDPTNNASHFVAVPARSWKPVTVKVETKKALKFS